MGGGQLGVDVGVKRTIDDTSLRDGEFVAVEPVPRRLDQRENGDDQKAQLMSEIAVIIKDLESNDIDF